MAVLCFYPLTQFIVHVYAGFKANKELPIGKQPFIWQNAFITVGIFVVSFYAFSTFGGNSTIESVKSGTLDLDESLTVGEAFESYDYFTDVEWTTFETDRNRILVEVTGTYVDDFLARTSKEDKDKPKKALLVVQFAVNRDGESFNVKYLGIEGITEDNREVTGRFTENIYTLQMVSGIEVLSYVYENILFKKPKSAIVYWDPKE